MTKLLVTGGSGMVGNALKRIRPEAIYTSSDEYDLTKEAEVKAMFEKYRPDEVIHLAARVGGIMDNMNHQAEYYLQNIMINTQVIHWAYMFGVKKLIGLASNCAYPNKVAAYPITEDQIHAGPPTLTNFSYAYAKRALIVQTQAYRKQYNCDFFSVIPCNMYGPHDNFDPKQGHFVAALIRKIHEAKQKGDRRIKLWGTGKPLRQFMYAEDLARVLLLLLENKFEADTINVAPRENLSIREIAETALNALGADDIKIEFDNSSPDGQFRKDIDAQKLFNIIGDFKMTPLIEGIDLTYKWYLNNVN